MKHYTPLLVSMGVIGLFTLTMNLFVQAQAEQPAVINRQMIEADWLLQADSWWQRDVPVSASSTAGDAAGAVDGVKNGLYAFHTNLEPFPCIIIDLLEPVALSKIIVYNRLDYAPGLHNADIMQIFVSDDYNNWKLIHDCAGNHFGGISGAPPLEVTFAPEELTTRYLRFQLNSSSPIFLHLDEIEAYGFDDPAVNIALYKPAEQSSLSMWSTNKLKERVVVPDKYPIDETLEHIAKLADYLLDSDLSQDTAQKINQLVSEANAGSTRDEGYDQGEVGKKEYLRLRTIGRQLTFLNPLVNFDKLLFAKRFTQQTYPDICLNHMPWVSQPGGDIFVLNNPFSLDGSDQSVKSLINGQLGLGHIRGIDLWWEGDRVVFGYAKQENFPFEEWPAPVGAERMIGHDLRLNQEPIHIFEINIDGTGLKQLTDHEMWSDLDPAYLPNGDIVFVSERCGFSLQCNNGPFHDETSCNLYTIQPDGSGLRWLSYNKDGDYQPHVLLDGTIGYCRWEYQERGWATLQSVWYIRPDGTGADVLFKQHLDNPWAFENTREIEGDFDGGGRKFVSVGAGHHTLAAGPICILTPNMGLNAESSIRIVTPGVLPPEGGMSGVPVEEGGVRENGGYYMYPWPLSDKFFLASYTYSNDYRPGSLDSFRGADERGYGIYLIDVFGNKELLYKDESISSTFPIPLQSRTRPPALPENRRFIVVGGNHDQSAIIETVEGVAESLEIKVPLYNDDGEEFHISSLAHCAISNVESGVDGIEPGEIKFVRVARRLGWPYTKETGGQRYEVDGSSWGISWAPALILGDVSVEADGSASFLVPSDASIYFQLLDANKQEIKRMRSFISFQPGESRGCFGCHETWENAPKNSMAQVSALLPPTFPVPPPWGNKRAISYLADVQPVLDRHCVSCHSGLKPAADLDFSGGLVASAPMKTDYRDLNFDGLNRSYRTMIEEKLVTYSDKHSPASELTQTRQFGSTKSKLIDAIVSGPCSKSISIRPGDEDWYRLVTWIDANIPYHDRFVNSRPANPPYDLPADSKLQQTVLDIHTKRCASCHNPQEVSRLDWIDIHEPEKSRFLTAPLAGTTGKHCSESVYKSANDTDYIQLKQTIKKAVEKAWQYPRRDLETLKDESIKKH